MMDTTTDVREQVSALMDGELRGEAFAQAVSQMAGDAQACADWNAFHVVGDVLRTGHRAAQGADMAFVERLRAQLQNEAVAPQVATADVVAPPARTAREAANAPAWRWKMAAGFASIAAVVAVGWNVSGLQGNRTDAQLAQAGASRVAAVPSAEPAQPVQLASGEPRQVMIRDARLDELLAAHKAGNASALQMPSGFLRNATFEGPAR